MEDQNNRFNFLSAVPARFATDLKSSNLFTHGILISCTKYYYKY